MRVNRRTQLQRIFNIALMIQSKPLSKQEIINRLEDKMDKTFSASQIEKDIFFLRMDLDAPIEFNYNISKYELSEPYDFKEALFNFVSL